MKTILKTLACIFGGLFLFILVIGVIGGGLETTETVKEVVKPTPILGKDATLFVHNGKEWTTTRPTPTTTLVIKERLSATGLWEIERYNEAKWDSLVGEYIEVTGSLDEIRSKWGRWQIKLYTTSTQYRWMHARLSCDISKSKYPEVEQRIFNLRQHNRITIIGKLADDRLQDFELKDCRLR